MASITEQEIFNVQSEEAFNSVALRIFEIQYAQIPVYQRFCDLLQRTPDTVSSIDQIPFLPISFFKTHRIIPENRSIELEFRSSGTTDLTNRSQHYVHSAELYEESLERSFKRFVGHPEELLICSLLPGYNENPQSSLIHMIELLGRKSRSGRVLTFSNHKELISKLKNSSPSEGKIVLFGVSFSLLDLAENYHGSHLPDVTIIETGGMKGKRKEITRAEMHRTIRSSLQPALILSEYGMTELLSQAYTQGQEDFSTMPWMKVLIRDVQDPLSVRPSGSGVLNIIDLANLHSCAFIATDDLGIVNSDGSFKVLGRTDHSEIRGCNLLYPV